MYYSPSTKPRSTSTAPRQPKVRRNNWIKELGYIAFCILTPLYMEFVVKIVNKTVFNARIFFYILLFSVSWGMTVYLICRLFPKRGVRFGITIGVTVLETILYGMEMILYQTFFRQYQGINNILGNAGDVAGGFGDDAVRSIFAYIFEIILLLVPLAILIFLSRRIIRSARPAHGMRTVCLVILIVSYLFALLLVYTDKSGDPSDKDYYTSSYTVTNAMERFGVLSGMRLDIKYAIFGKPTQSLSGTLDGDVTLPKDDTTQPSDSGNASGGDTTQAPVTYEPNTLNIDFAGLSASAPNNAYKELDDYFAGQPNSMKNEYTGMFKGKNCIFITAESFTPYFVTKETTPILYKMMNEGFVFNDYYQPAWGVSTSDGEYSGLTGLVPESGINSMKSTKSNLLYTSLGNSFTRLGYFTAAYHANSYTYYDRNLTHPNFGYSAFIGYGNGIEVGVDKTWPESDLQAMQTVIPWFIDKQPFHVYYMSVSGHPLYSFTGNYMASKNKDLVANLPYSDAVKSYISCNYEFEFSLEYLMEQLEAEGIADDTVIVINADHYPYGLDEGFEGNTQDYFSELVGHTIDTNFERHKNRLIIYCADMKEPVVVDEPCYSLDILPTLSNLFGFEYDSRLYTGRDVMSDATPLVIFRNYSWITDKGRYNASTKEFTPVSGAQVADDYISQVSQVVKSKVYVAAQILETDYYRYLFG